mmetsp:Transcript_10659/g.29213  ORF Transcript_10659/g.29213 Transcript_10659/m.29213 type:complete len:239 (-) Transcript_10659:103-819(-)
MRCSQRLRALRLRSCTRGGKNSSAGCTVDGYRGYSLPPAERIDMLNGEGHAMVEVGDISKSSSAEMLAYGPFALLLLLLLLSPCALGTSSVSELLDCCCRVEFGKACAKSLGTENRLSSTLSVARQHWRKTWLYDTLASILQASNTKDTTLYTRMYGPFTWLKKHLWIRFLGTAEGWGSCRAWLAREMSTLSVQHSKLQPVMHTASALSVKMAAAMVPSGYTKACARCCSDSLRQLVS